MKQWKGQFETILSHTSMVYFFANQLRLLELANLDVITSGNMIDHLEAWGRLRHNYLSCLIGSTQNNLIPPQIVAWSDPSDLLSWNVPELKTVVVKNRSVKNATHWLWLLDSPTGAHGNYDKNKSVIGVMLKPTKYSQAQ